MRIDLRRILCPVDFSPTSDHAIRYAVTLAESFGAELILLHVSAVPSETVCQFYGLTGLDPGLAITLPYSGMPAEREEPEETLGEPFEDQGADEDAEPPFRPDEGEDLGLEELADRLCEAYRCTVTTRLREGEAFVEIVALAREEVVDLIVMGTHGRTGLAHMLIGSTAERVVRMASCPVLTVKHPEHEFVMP